MSTFEIAKQPTTVWKYTLDITDMMQAIEMPAMAHVVHVAMQRGQLCLWAHVTPTMPPEVYHFAVHGTGHPVTGEAHYIGAALDDRGRQGALVWHVFQVAS